MVAVIDGAFEQFALVENRAITHQRHQVRRIHHAPAGLRSLDQLVGHGQAGGAGTGALGDPGPQAHGGEGRLDGVRRPQVYPVLGRIPVELQQHLSVADDLCDRFRILRGVVDLERLDRDLRPVDVFGIEDLPHRHDRTRMRRLRQRGKHIGLFVEPAALLTGVWEHPRSAAQKPNAPSPTAKTGGRMPRRRSRAADRPTIRWIPDTRRSARRVPYGRQRGPRSSPTRQFLLLEPHLQVDTVDPQIHPTDTHSRHRTDPARRTPGPRPATGRSTG